MAILAAMMLAVCIACSVWLITHRAFSRRTIAQRMQQLSGAVAASMAPGAVALKSASSRNDLTIENIVSDSTAKSLFLSGIRSSAQVRRFHLIKRIGLIFPLVMIVLLAVNSRLTPSNFLIMALFAACAYLLIAAAIRRRMLSRRKRLLRALPQFLDLLLVCVEAGLGFTAALERVLKEMDERELLVQEFNVLYHEFLSGLSLSEACQRMSRRCELPELSIFLSTIVQSDQMGASLGHALRSQASELRDKFKQRMRERAHKVPVLIVFPTMLLLMTIMIITAGPPIYGMVQIFKKTDAFSKPKGAVPHVPSGAKLFKK